MTEAVEAPQPTGAAEPARREEGPGEEGPRTLRRRVYEWRTWLVFAVIVVIGTVARVPLLHRIFSGRKAFRQAQTAWAIREYARRGIDLLNPPLPILGPPWRLWLEFPLPQAVGSLFVHAGLTPTVAGRLEGLLSLQVTALLLFLLMRRLAGNRAAIIAVALLETVPLTAWFGANASIEFFVTSLVLGSVLGLIRFLDNGRWWWWVTAAVCSALAFMVKVTTGTAWMIPLIVLVLVSARPDWRSRWRRSLLGLVAAPGAGLAGEAWWAHWSTVNNDASRFTVFQTFHADWRGVVGTVHDRLIWSKYDILIHRMGELMTGRAWLFAVAIIAIAVFARRNRAVLLSLAAVPVTGAFVWFPLYVQHDYYPCAVVPAAVAVMAVGIDATATAVATRWRDGLRWAGRWTATVLSVAGVLLLLGLSWTSGFGHQVRADLRAHPKMPWESVVMRTYTPKDAKIIMIGCSWDSRYLYNADRWGLMYIKATFGPLSADYVSSTYQYVMVCGGPRQLGALPQSLTYEPVATGLYRIQTP